MSGKARILIVEDTPSQAELLRALLAGEGHDLRIKDSAGGAFDLVRTWDPDVILLDLELPDYSGFELMRQLRAASINTAVIVITANASVNTAVEAMREGAVDFLMKPFNRARLTVTLGNCLEKRALAAELQSIKGQLGRVRFFGFIGASAAMQAVYRTIEAVATSKASVFVTGESGTGKELAADAVHRASPRRAKPFIALNCGAIPRDLLESEIFGHVKGAFTGATDNRVGAAKAADGGTLFLDEIGEMPLDMQVKLLRFVQTGTFTAVGGSRTEKVDIRFVCATNRDPMLEVQEGRFREDLFYRLYVVPIELPPLRERGDDVLLIARQFLVDFAKEEGRRFQRFAPDVEWLMLSYRWPGNVRQLQNAVRNIVVLHDAEVVEVSMLPPALMVGASPEQLRQAAQAAVSAAPPRAPAATPILPAAPSPGPAAALPPEAPAIPDTVSIMGQADMAPGLTQARHIAPPPVMTPPPTPIPPDRSATALQVESDWVEPDRVEPGRVEPTPVEPTPVEPVGVEPVGATDRTPLTEIEIIPLAEMEKRLILAALDRTANDVPQAAALLRINPSTIYRKLQGWRGAAPTRQT